MSPTDNHRIKFGGEGQDWEEAKEAGRSPTCRDGLVFRSRRGGGVISSRLVGARRGERAKARRWSFFIGRGGYDTQHASKLICFCTVGEGDDMVVVVAW